CNSTPKQAGVQNAQTTTINSDTAGLAQFQQWKAQNELAALNQYGQANQPAAPATQTKVVYVPQRSTTKSSTASRSSSSGSTSAPSTTPAQKKGISKAAKGAIIGGVAGAAGGAVINKKNRAAGGVIGGVLGAGVGYGIGRSKDKKDGRY
ncbi:MAG: hypothetical protein ACXWV9_11135, partial [Flavisolibacter sp.]